MTAKVWGLRPKLNRYKQLDLGRTLWLGFIDDKDDTTYPHRTVGGPSERGYHEKNHVSALQRLQSDSSPAGVLA